MIDAKSLFRVQKKRKKNSGKIGIETEITIHRWNGKICLLFSEIRAEKKRKIDPFSKNEIKNYKFQNYTKYLLLNFMDGQRKRKFCQHGSEVLLARFPYVR